MPRKRKKPQQPPSPKRKRGGQPGNHNALKHGFYSIQMKQSYLDQLTALLQRAPKSLDQATALRIAIDSALAHCPDELTPMQAVMLLKAATESSATVRRLIHPLDE